MVLLYNTGVHGILVSVERAGLGEPLAAEITLEALLPGVNDHVLLQLGGRVAGLVAHSTTVHLPALKYVNKKLTSINYQLKYTGLTFHGGTLCPKSLVKFSYYTYYIEMDRTS